MSRTAALTQTVASGTSCAASGSIFNAGSTTTPTSSAIGYGVSGIASITNGSTAPGATCNFLIYVSYDNSTFYLYSSQAGPVNVSSTYTFNYSLAPGGNGGDWLYYYIQFTGNTGQSVTVQCNSVQTTGI